MNIEIDADELHLLIIAVRSRFSLLQEDGWPERAQCYRGLADKLQTQAQTACSTADPVASRDLRPAPPDVDRTAVELAGGGQVTADHRDLKPNGQQKGYVVLSAYERARGFVRPLRLSYTHLTCGTDTSMSQDIAATYARDPGFYSGTFCVYCSEHRPLTEFVWKGTDEQVGS